MIEHSTRLTTCEFGNGDIIVGAVGYNPDCKKTVSVNFSNDIVRPIGETTNFKDKPLSKFDGTSVLLRFSKTESIDVVINKLKEAKASLINKLEEQIND